jgi:hypothetical protein
MKLVAADSQLVRERKPRTEREPLGTEGQGNAKMPDGAAIRTQDAGQIRGSAGVQDEAPLLPGVSSGLDRDVFTRNTIPVLLTRLSSLRLLYTAYDTAHYTIFVMPSGFITAHQFLTRPDIYCERIRNIKKSVCLLRIPSAAQ